MVIHNTNGHNCVVIRREDRLSVTALFGFVTKHACDRETDGQTDRQLPRPVKTVCMIFAPIDRFKIVSHCFRIVLCCLHKVCERVLLLRDIAYYITYSQR